MRSIFLEKSYTKCGRETSPRPPLDQQYEISYSLLLLYIKVEEYQNILKNHFLLPQNKRGLELISLSHFLHDFSRKIFLTLYSINWPNFIAWLPLLQEILCNIIFLVIIYFPVYDVINFEITLAFLSSHFPTWPKYSV